MLIDEAIDIMPPAIQIECRLIRSIIDVNKETLNDVLEECISINISFVYDVIEFALFIRPHSTEAILTLLSLLIKKINIKPEVSSAYLNSLFSKNKSEFHRTREVVINDIMLDDIYSENSIYNTIKNDDVESLIRSSSEPMFDFAEQIYTGVDSIIYFVDSKKSISYTQLMAFFGSIKCFKHAILTGDYKIIDIELYAIAGENSEIINYLRNKDYSFNYCFEVGIKFHRNELCNWLQEHYECERVELKTPIRYYNYSVLFYLIEKHYLAYNSKNEALITASQKCLFELIKYLVEVLHADINKILNNSFRNAIERGNYEYIKYLNEKRMVDLEKKFDDRLTPLIIVLQRGHIEVFKYLYETCHINNRVKDEYGDDPIRIAASNDGQEIVKYFYEKLNVNVKTKDGDGFTPIYLATNANKLDTVKYLYEHCNVDIEVKDNYGDTPMNNAAYNGYLEMVKYLFEVCHANVETKNKFELTPLINASCNGHFEVVKYLCEVCHVVISNEAIRYAKTERIKEYLISK